MANQNTTEDGAGEAKPEPSGPKGDNPSTAGHGKTQVVSDTPENAQGAINPSAPNDGIIPHAK